jgi:hypothetical protein
MTVVVGLDWWSIIAVGLPACRSSAPSPHQAGGELIVVMPRRGSGTLSRLPSLPRDPPLRLSPILGLADVSRSWHDIWASWWAVHSESAGNPRLTPGVFLPDGDGDSPTRRRGPDPVGCSCGRKSPSGLGLYSFQRRPASRSCRVTIVTRWYDGGTGAGNSTVGASAVPRLRLLTPAPVTP